MRAKTTVAFLLALGLLLATAPMALGQDDAQSARDAERERAREARILDYLRKREERLAQRDMRRDAKQQYRDQQAQTQTAAQPTTATMSSARPKKAGKSDLPRPLAQAQENVRRSQIATDPTVQHWLAKIDQRQASPHELAAFANFLADAGLAREALTYYSVAIRLEQNDPTLWINLGTLHRQLRELNHAASAYGEALGVDPNNAFAHYNLGAVLDEQGEYKEAIYEYKVALSLDPSLGDPRSNPQAANNPRLMAVRLLLYQEQSGAMGLPLLDVPGASIEPPKPGRQ